MPDKPDQFRGVPRKGMNPYEEWFVGVTIRLNKDQDFSGKPKNVIAAALQYAKRSGFAAAAAPCLSAAGLPTSVMIWGDKSRGWEEGTPEEIRAQFEAAGIHLRR